MKEKIKELYYQGFSPGYICDFLRIKKATLNVFIDEVIFEHKKTIMPLLVQIEIIERKLFEEIEIERLDKSRYNKTVVDNLQRTYVKFNIT